MKKLTKPQIISIIVVALIFIAGVKACFSGDSDKSSGDSKTNNVSVSEEKATERVSAHETESTTGNDGYSLLHGELLSVNINDINRKNAL